MSEEEKQMQVILHQYKIVFDEVHLGLNLEKNLREIEASIKEIDELISKNETVDNPCEAYKTIKNELYYLKLQILEQT